MTLYSVYIFNRYGDNIYYAQWKRTSAVQEGEASLVAGFIYTLQHLSSQLSSTGLGGLKAVQTPLYKLHFAETMTGYRVALLTDKDMNTSLVQGILAEMFREVFQKTVTKDPNYRHELGCMITAPEFGEALEGLFRAKQLLE
ncbi:trafficking protein particle complex subunit 1 [Trypanosoma grayi]|uniref:trafficking protein particle complex subunit 1 n=1 Tax=Trypanosoma grayi TaxID=71804 RepID=UPI0004F44813|nr:trafficking protein particle complex subunit 1 [Trypanosoma grayi]KEG15202.1 trafficking protein particle complex subunit 1 [Trypanosoma grayi]